ncbi:hypothetical protein D4R78_02455 [bacterium]|nr:MAG: hypothetical protein D4R78_02455 [bacterium]
MRDLLFKNLTSEDKKRRIIASSEITDREGVRTAIHRHFICIIKEIKDNKFRQSLPSICVLKERNTRAQREKFFCRIKSSVYAVNNGRLFLILFMHSLKINLTIVTNDLKTLN